jgi:Flp pilus assembly protein TadG
MILVALAMVAIIAMAALSIDVVTLYLARSEAQRAADSAALAAARILSISGVTGDPNNPSGNWLTACTVATQVAQAVANQNMVGGTAASSATVTFLYKGTTTDCSSLPAGFAVNPQVQVQVQRTSLPTFFARIWSRNANSVSATATAEAFNPSGSDALLSSIIPVQPRCVKPWIVPNKDPASGGTGTFVDPATGAITSPGIRLSGTGTGEVGENFSLFADCASGTPCALVTSPPSADVGSGPTLFDGNNPPHPPPSGNNLEYLPGQVPSSATAVPSCGDDSPYQEAVAGCDQTTAYQCGVASGNTVDLNENPGGATGDTAVAAQCLIHQRTAGTSSTDQDSLDTSSFFYKVKAGGNNPLGIANSVVTSSNSIVSLPIYDGSTLTITSNTAPVTIVGFLQVFINYVNIDGSMYVTVLNVVGCGNGTKTTSTSPAFGSSPVPVRLITPP